MRKQVVTFFFVLCTIYSFSQHTPLKFSHITTEDGLSSSWIRCIYQDKMGFIWFGTGDGLNRYNGHTIKVFKADPLETNSLVHGAITYIAERYEKELWICTEQGVSTLNLENNCFRPFPYLNKVRVTHVLTDHDDIVWFSSHSGIYRYDKSDSTIVNYRNVPADMSSLSSDQVDMCMEDKDNNLWIATQNGLNYFDRGTATFYRYTAGDHIHSISGNHIISLLQDNENRIWVGLTDTGVDLMFLEKNDPLQAQFKHIVDSRSNCLLMDQFNTLWIGNSLGTGISLLDLTSVNDINFAPVENYRNTSDDTNSLSDNSISSILEDRDGGIWVGTFAGGINYYSPMRKKFNVVKHIPGNENSLHSNVVNCFLEDGYFLWIGTEEGLCRFDQRTGNFKTFLHQEDNNRSLGANGIIDILKDSKGNLWVKT